MLNYKINCLGKIIFSSVQLLSHIWLFAISWSHARPPCPSPTPRVNSNSRPSSQWCHPDISSSVIPLDSCPQFLPASESFPMSQLFAWGGQSTGVSALASFPPKKSQPPSPSPTESKRLFYISVSLLLSHIQGYCYHLSKSDSYSVSNPVSF